jgi:quinol monooxygenase YgiN
MFMRITWGRLIHGSWPEFEATFKRTTETVPQPEGLVARWLIQDESDPDAGYVIGLWSTSEAMHSASDSPEWERLYVEPLREYFSGEYSKTMGEVRWSWGASKLG